VAADVALMGGADGGLFWLDGPSLGCGAEIALMALMEAPIAAMVPLSMRAHPFLGALCAPVITEDLERAIGALRWALGLSDVAP
jgi:hypothetical protein